MATIITNLISSKVLSNLDTYNYTVLAAGVHTVSIRLTEVPPDGVTIVLKNNSSTLATSSAPAGPSDHVEIAATVNCALSDVLGIVITSSAAHQAAPNRIKAILSIRQGAF